MHRLVLRGLAGPMDVVNLSLLQLVCVESGGQPMNLSMELVLGLM